MRKTVLISAALVVAASLNSFAQETTERFPSFGNMSVELGGGVNAIYNDGHIYGYGAAAELRLAKWLTPDFGLRAGISGLKNSAPDASWNTGKGSFNQYSLDADVLWDPISTFAGYNSARKFGVQPYFRMSVLDVKGNDKGHNLEYAAGGGIRATYKATKALSLYLNGHGLIGRESAYRSSGHFVVFPTVTAGLSFAFGRQGFRRTVETIREVPVEKIVEVIKEVPVEVEKQVVVKEAASAESDMASLIVYFDLASDALSMENRNKIDAFVRTELASGAEIVITGSADKATGNAKINAELAQRRVDAVWSALVNYCGVSPSRIVKRAVGDSANIGTPEENRCVTIAGRK